MLLPPVLQLPHWMLVFLALLTLAFPVAARVADVHPNNGSRLRSQCARDPLYRSFTDPHWSAVASSFCSTYIRSTVRAEATRTQTHTVHSTEQSRVTAIATVTSTTIIGTVETDTSTSTTSETITIDASTTSVSTTDVPTTVSTDLITTTVSTEIDTITVTSTTTTTSATATVTIVGRGYPDPHPGHWDREYGCNELSSACSCLLATAPPARTIYTGTMKHVTTDVVVIDITTTVTATTTMGVSSTSTSTTEIAAVTTQLTSLTTTVTTVQTTTTEEVPTTETTTVDATTTTTTDVTATTTIGAIATETATCCECEPPFLLQVSGSSVNGQYVVFEYSSLLQANALGFGSESAASTFTLDSQCRLITGGYYSAVDSGDFYAILKEVTSGYYTLTCSVKNGGLSCFDDAGSNIGDDEFAYNTLGYLAFETSGGSHPLTLNVVPA